MTFGSRKIHKMSKMRKQMRTDISAKVIEGRLRYFSFIILLIFSFAGGLLRIKYKHKHSQQRTSVRIIDGMANSIHERKLIPVGAFG